MIEKFNYQDKRLIFICVIISVISLFITQNYFKQAFPYASIDMDVTKDAAQELATKFLTNKGYDIQNYKHAARFGYFDDAKKFLEYQLSAEESGKILNETNSYYWKNRWFIPEQKEEFKVNISTTGELAQYEHIIDEDALGDALSKENALQIAQLFLTGAVGLWDMENWKLENTNTEVQNNRIDHEFEWKEKSFDTKEGSHRITVRVQGSEVNYYNEWIKVSSTWTRDFDKTDSNNSLLFMVHVVCFWTIISSILISVILRARKKDLRWKTAFIYSGILVVLGLIHHMNMLPLQFYSYETKDSIFSFWLAEVFSNLVTVPVLIFLFIGMMLAGSEPFYRDQYPQQISFRHILTLQGIKSRSFFNSAIIGISLTFALLAFRTIYHLISNNLGGWTPTDMPAIDKLDTFIPWVSVLFSGYKNAFLNPVIYFMFLMPLLQKYTKSSALAVIICSIIWGFGHAAEPAQPFYVHAMEMSAAVLIASLIFLKYGILSIIIWQFSSGAIVSSMILLRSGNSYFISTGAVCAGLVLIPLIYSIISYRKKGGFVSSRNLVNALDTEIFEEKKETKEEINEAVISAPYIPLSKKRVKAGLIIGFIGIFSFIAIKTLINDPLSDLIRLDKNSSDAVKISKDYLMSQGFDLENYRSAAELENALPENIATRRSGSFFIHERNKHDLFDYIQQTLGKDTLKAYLSETDLRTNQWSVRFFKPETKREYKVWVNAKGQDNDIVYFEETLADTTYIPSLSKENAQDLVNQFANKQGIDLINIELVDNSKTDQENRFDYYFKYKANNHKNNIAEAEAYYEFEVYGNHIGMFKMGLKIPENWLWTYYKNQTYDTIFIYVELFSCILLFVLAIRYLMVLLKDKKPNWKLAFILITIYVLSMFLISINEMPTLLYEYDTTQPLGFFVFEHLLLHLVGAVVSGFIFFIPILLLNLVWPDFYNTFKKNNRPLYLKDAFVCLFSSLGFYSIYICIKHLLIIYHPTYFSFDTTIINPTDQIFFFQLLYNEVLFWTFMLFFFILGTFSVYRQFTIKSTSRKLFLIVFLALPFFMPAKLELIQFIDIIIWAGCILILLRYFCRGNPWGYLFGIVGFFTLPYFLSYYHTIQVPDYRYHILAVIFCIGLFFLYFLKEAFYKPKIIDG